MALALALVFNAFALGKAMAGHGRSDAVAAGAEAEGGGGESPKSDRSVNRQGKDARDGRSAPPLTPEQIATVLQILREHHPALAQRLEEALEKHPERAQRILAEQWPRLGRLLDLKQRDPQTYEMTLAEIKLMGQARDLVVDWRAAMKNKEIAQADQIRQQLIGLMGQMFDIAQQMRLREADRLEEKAKELRQQVQERQNERDDLIQQRLEQFLKRPGASSAGPSPFGGPPPEAGPGGGPGDGASPPPPPMGHAPAEMPDQPI